MTLLRCIQRVGWICNTNAESRQKSKMVLLLVFQQVNGAAGLPRSPLLFGGSGTDAIHAGVCAGLGLCGRTAHRDAPIRRWAERRARSGTTRCRTPATRANASTCATDTTACSTQTTHRRHSRSTRTTHEQHLTRMIRMRRRKELSLDEDRNEETGTSHGRTAGLPQPFLRPCRGRWVMRRGAPSLG